MTSKSGDLSRLFNRDCFNNPVEPDQMYQVIVARTSVAFMHEIVSGEDLLAACEWLQQQKDKQDE